MPRSVRLASEVLVGRDEETRDVLAALRNLPDGHPGVVLVGGPAGIGKTRFVATLADRLRTDGMRVLAGACLDLRAGAPPHVALIAAFRSVDPPAVQLLDALTGAVDMRRSRLFELLRSTMTALARRKPTVLVIEDVHWSDRITRDALLYLTAIAREGRWALVVTYRDDELAARPATRELLDTLGRDALVHVSLDVLSPDEVSAQVAGIAGSSPSQEHADRLHRRTGGIPLLVEEVLAAEAAGVNGVPDHVRDLLLARVARLGARASRVVEVVAVAGDRSDERLVAGVLGIERSAAADALDRGVVANVLVAAGPGYRVRHELFREAVYDALPPARRRRLHARLAEMLAEATHPDTAALAHHWYEADEPTRAAEANLEAAALAERVHAPAEVHVYLHRVLEHFAALPRDSAMATGGRGALLARAGDAAYLGGAFTRAVELAEQSLSEPGEPADVAVRWERLARYCWVSADGAGAEHAHQRSLTALPDNASVSARVQVLANYAWYLGMVTRRDEARRWSEWALTVVEDGSDPLDRCRALLGWGLARADEDAGLTALREARELAIRCDSSDELGRAHAGLDIALRRPGHTAEREQMLRDGLRYTTAHGLGRSYAAVMAYLLGELLLDIGKWEEADETLRQVVARCTTGLPAVFGLAFQARLAAARGDPAGAAASAGEVVKRSTEIPQQPYPVAVAWCALAESCLWAGDIEQASVHAGQAMAVATDPLCVAQVEAVHSRASADLAADARRHRRPVSVPPDGDAYRALTDPHPMSPPYGATVQAEMSRRSGARDPGPWRDAVGAWDVVPDPYRAAYCRWRLAQALLADRTGRAEARHALTAAHETATQLRARPLLEAVEQLAATARIRLGTDSPLSGPAAAATELGLTHREMEIVPYLVAGRTNTEIAEALVISPRTVGVHVSRILSKLGAARRTEAADIARRRGLVD